MKLERVANQILQELPHLNGITRYGRQFAHVDPAARLAEANLQIRDDAQHDFVEIDGDERLRHRRDPRKFQKVGDQDRHARGRVLDSVQVIAAFGVQNLGVLLPQAADEGVHFSERFLQIMGSDHGEVFQLAVALQQADAGRA